MKYYSHFLRLQELLTKGENAVLMIVVDHKGSSPGKTGFKMVVSKNTTFGTVGGGIMEQQLVFKCRDFIKRGHTSAEFLTLVHGGITKEGEQLSGLSCAGKQTVALVPVTNADIVTKIIDNYFGVNGQLQICKALTFRLLPMEQTEKYHYSENCYTEHIGLYYHNIVYIFGGGHVGLAISKNLALLDFYTVIVDHREDVDTLVQNKYVYNKIMGKDYIITISAIKEKIMQRILDPKKLYLVIVTTDMQTDITVLQAIYDKLDKYNIRYIGLMGSKSKLQKIKATVHIPKEFLKQIHAPIGLDIHSFTVEEIAVAVSAELISVKNKKNNT